MLPKQEGRGDDAKYEQGVCLVVCSAWSPVQKKRRDEMPSPEHAHFSTIQPKTTRGIAGSLPVRAELDEPQNQEYDAFSEDGLSHRAQPRNSNGAKQEENVGCLVVQV